MKYVVDASVAIKWYVPEIYEKEADLLLHGGDRLHVPELILPESANIIWKKVLRGEVTQTEGQLIIAALLKKEWTIHSHQKTLVAAYLGAQDTRQTVYDFTYMALAVSLGCEFVTADKKFYEALESTPFKANLKWIGEISRKRR
jgi:predicted nucleic acid-binding protein